MARKRFLDGDPGLSKTQKAQQRWSDKISVGDATIRVFFPPESGDDRQSLDAIVEAVKNARHSVLLCAYDPTDKDLLDAVFQAGDDGKMMLALVDRVPGSEPTGDPNRGDVAAKIEIFDRASQSHDIVGFGAFKSSDTPNDFVPEHVLRPHEDPKIMVRVHHKFIITDGEGKSPVVCTGSANFSGNSVHKNIETRVATHPELSPGVDGTIGRQQ